VAIKLLTAAMEECEPRLDELSLQRGLVVLSALTPEQITAFAEVITQKKNVALFVTKVDQVGYVFISLKASFTLHFLTYLEFLSSYLTRKEMLGQSSSS
jgi:hypothetical protein